MQHDKNLYSNRELRREPKRNLKWIALFGLAWLTACATSPLGRRQLLLVPDAQMDQMGEQAFQQLKTKEPIVNDPRVVQYVNCIVNPLVATAKDQMPVNRWDVVVFQNDTANAFALPGGKIGVYTGLLKVAKTDAQLAAVIGHEIGHVIARHGAERVSQQVGIQLGLTVLNTAAPDSPKKKLVMGLLGVGSQVGILLPFGRTQESESDLIGLDLMSRAGFDPRQSVDLWKNMISASGGAAPPEFLSTHPASENRIRNLEAHMSAAMSNYDQSRSAGREPRCVR